jgi:hypothetical protein|tara:strand:+ start:347 stop:724 length:378 start_codon:yes stop_codon:yes gene_type:complete
MAILIKSNQTMPTTLQGFFTRAYRWASRPEFTKCKDVYNKCRYRSDDGTNACFIGACIPDNLYHPEMEDEMLDEMLHKLGIEVDPRILRELQLCHDKPSAHSNMDSIKMLNYFAKKHSLKIPSIK